MHNPTRPPKPSDCRLSWAASHNEVTCPVCVESRRRQRELRQILWTALAGLASISVLWRLLD